uniref:non-specific serine/threonine protein kinase n=1 Tax=Brassica campestris TaxID=3711 RepID=M4EPU2_BRACM
MARQRRRSLCLLITVWFLSGSVHVVRAQNRTGATTDPDEGVTVFFFFQNNRSLVLVARALNSIFAAWRIPAPREWNISGELCSGAAMDDSVTIDDKAYNPLIKCDCTFNSSKICRITALKVYAIEVVGPIPPQLWTLHYLTNLNLGQNVLTGSLPPAIGNLTRMQYMTFGINALSGPVPKEIGLLKDLRSLGISSNNFSGSIPPEIGSCTKLQKMYIGSSGLTGGIPQSFANLVQLEDAWITDLEVTGPIPDFIGNWTKLTTLRILGTGLSGPIPSSFSNLTSLTELRLGDISNGSSSLEFFKDMKSLSTLVFRNSNLTGTIPSFIGEFSSLQQVDLSFNKLGGPIPASLFNLSRLTHLFLGNNTLNGPLPSQKSQTLRNIDVSYNDLSGSLPSWVNLPNLKLNLVANSFSLEGLDKSVLPGLSCLQKDFPCNRGKALYSEFSINCGGPPIRSVSGALFEREDEELGPASFVVSDVQRWAASSVGLFAGSSSNIYIATSQSQFIGTLDSELFQSARLSASSLRYYGLGLENGGYTVTLQFAEIQILGSTSNTWRGLGRRRFDIYVQGRLVETDFDVRRTAGDSTVRAVQRVYKANVTENYLEIHLFWAGKGTCCIPIQGAYGPLISAVSAKSDFTPTVGNRPPSKGKNRTGTIVGVIVGLGLLSILAGVAIFIIRKRRKRYTDDEELLSMDVKPYTFTYSELKSATQDFDPSNKLGEGGFGPVYKGKLNDGREVAVKLLSVGSRQGKGQFVAEIVAISAVQHRNLVKLYGCCYEGDHRLLVYEYLPNGSLDQALFGDKTLHLDWSTRYEICLGVARGLVYLHEEARLRIVHRDVKASNILLDSNLVPKVSDFGLSKLYDDKKTHISTRVAGTIGYLAPEYAMRGHLTEKTDVYAFGVVALELVSGRPNSDENLEDEKRYLLEWAWNLHEKSREVELIDRELTEFNMEEVKRMIGIALLCTQTSHALRPPMSRVVAMLSGDVEVSDVTSKPGYLTDWRFDDTTSSSLSGFQTKETWPSDSLSTSFVAPGSEISPRSADSKPMLGVKINEGR